MSEHVSKREIEPFSFWPYSSAIPGLGGSDHGPDLNYCFHTLYHEYQPGTVIFTVTLRDAKASHGELAIRAHAFQPDTGRDATLVAGSRTPLEGLNGSDLEITVRIGAIPGVQYALFGYFSESSDLQASGLSVVIEEKGGANPEDYVRSDTARSLFEAARVDTPSRLIADGAPSFAHPVSQAMTAGQVESLDYMASWPAIATDRSGPAGRWRQAYVLQVLQVYGMLRDGACGVLVTSLLLPLGDVIEGHGCRITELQIVSAGNAAASAGDQDDGAIMTTANSGTLGVQFDFAIAITAADWFADKAAFFEYVNATLRQVLRGGVAIFLFDYVVDDRRSTENKATDGGFMPCRTDIEQLALRIISHGSDVAQLNFAEGTGTSRAMTEPCPFGLIVRR